MTTAAATNPPLSKVAVAWKAFLLLTPLVIAGLLLLLRQAEVRQLRSRTISSYGMVPSFELTNQNGQTFGSAQLGGKIWIADFIFTMCPGPCPMISSRMSELQKPLEKTDVHLVSFSVDPEHDTPQVLRGYAEKLNAQPQRWDFLTGPKDAIYDSRMMALSSASRTGARRPARPCTAPVWYWWIDRAKFAVTTMRPRPTR